MLKTGETTELQMRVPTELPTQRQSVGRRLLMFPLTRLLIAGIIFALVTLSVLVVAGISVAGIAVLIGQLHPVDLSVGFVSGLSNEALEAIGIILMFGVLAVAGIITLVLMGKVIERRSLAEVGLGRRGLLRHTALGLGIGAGAALLYILMVILAMSLGVMDPSYVDLSSDWQPFGVFGNLGLILVFTCWVAVAEEIIFRGFLFRIVEEGLGSWLALAISALLFGMVHLPNFDDPSLLDVASQMTGGVSLAAAYMLTRKLWLPIGIHWGWDLLLFAIDGGDFVSVLTSSWDSGGGALETVLGVLPDLILSIVLLALVIRRGQIRTPRWMQRKRRTDNMTSGDINVAPLTEEKAAYERIARSSPEVSVISSKPDSSPNAP
jgi:uncharacterized protein